MNFLCICQYGHSRSVCLARQFHKRGKSAVAIGFRTSGSALSLLCEWADKICIVDGNANDHIDEKYTDKCLDFNVGPDRWVNPYHHELEQILNKMLDEHGL